MSSTTKRQKCTRLDGRLFVYRDTGSGSYLYRVSLKRNLQSKQLSNAGIQLASNDDAPIETLKMLYNSFPVQGRTLRNRGLLYSSTYQMDRRHRYHCLPLTQAKNPHNRSLFLYQRRPSAKTHADSCRKQVIQSPSHSRPLVAYSMKYLTEQKSLWHRLLLSNSGKTSRIPHKLLETPYHLVPSNEPLISLVYGDSRHPILQHRPNGICRSQKTHLLAHI